MASSRYLFEVAEFSWMKSTWLWAVMSVNCTSGDCATLSEVEISTFAQPRMRSDFCSHPVDERLLTIASGLRCISALRHVVAHLLELVVLLIQPRERLQCFLTLLDIPESAVDARENVVIGRRAWIQSHRVIQGIGSLLKVSLPFLSPCLLKPCGVRLGIEFECLLRTVESLRRVSGAVVERTQVHMSGDEIAMALVVEGDRLLVSLNRAGIVPEGFPCKTERINRLDVSRIDPQSLLKLLARRDPIVLQRKQLAQIVVAFTRVWRVANGLFKLLLCRVKTADRHQITS